MDLISPMCSFSSRRMFISMRLLMVMATYIVLCTTLEASPPKKTCPAGWLKVGDKCIIYKRDLKTWKGAREACAVHEGDLLTLRTQDKAKIVNDYLVKIKATLQPWIGLSHLSDTGSYAWLDESNSTKFNLWADDEPSAKGNNCAVILMNEAFGHRWASKRCDLYRAYLCEIHSQDPKNVDCGLGWEYLSSLNVCYQVNTKPALNWRDAEDWCVGHDGHLMSVRGLEEIHLLAGNIRGNPKLPYWIGGNELSPHRGWQWSDGSPFTVINWDNGTPNSTVAKNCVVYRGGGSSMSASDCSHSYPFICTKQSNVKEAKRRIPTPPANIAKNMEWACPPQWFSHKSWCFNAFSAHSGLNWHGARLRCTRMGADLASIADMEENDAVLQMLGSKDYRQAWLGLNINSSNRFDWSNGDDVTFTYWAAGQPISTINKLHYCGQMMDNTGTWELRKCSDKANHFVCKQVKKVRKSAETSKHKGCERDGGKRFKSKCYILTLDTATFAQAEQRCRNDGAQLAIVNDRYVQAFLTTFLYRHQHPSMMELINPYERSNYWIGLSNTNTNTALGKPGGIPTTTTRYSYAWISGVNGSSSSLDYTNWDRSHTGLETDSCVAMSTMSKPPGQWHSTPCHTHNKYICQYDRHDGGATLTPGYSGTTATPAGAFFLPCPKGWYGFKHLCYTLVAFQLSWSDAQLHCQTYHSHNRTDEQHTTDISNRQAGALASVTSLAISRGLAQIPDIKKFGQVWIGLNNRDQEGGWHWVAGEPFTFADWSSTPNNTDSNRCVVFTPRQINTDCELKKAFLCQVPRAMSTPGTKTPSNTQPKGGDHSPARSSGLSNGELGSLVATVLIVCGIFLFVLAHYAYKRRNSSTTASSGFDNMTYTHNNEENINNKPGSVHLDNIRY